MFEMNLILFLFIVVSVVALFISLFSPSFLLYFFEILAFIILFVLEIIYNVKESGKILDDFYDYLDSNDNFEDFKYSRESEELTPPKRYS
ncbi:MAG: hypothetical protein PHG41_07630 [Actinomycetota bacterium]|nr:hypothetical protein [Actinomycetota bacterium]